MGAGMIAMVALPAGVVPRVWQQGAFCALAFWLAIAGLRYVRDSRRRELAALPGSHPGHHLTASLAMAYMAAAPPDPVAGMAGMHMAAGSGGLPVPVAGWLLVAYFAGYAGWSMTGLARVSMNGPAGLPGGPPGVGAAEAVPQLRCACQVVMALAMACMLLSML